MSLKCRNSIRLRMWNCLGRNIIHPAQMQNLIMTIIDIISPCHQRTQQPQHYCKQRPTRMPSWLSLPRALTPTPSRHDLPPGVGFLCSLVQWTTARSSTDFGKILIKQVLTDVPATKGRERKWLVLTYMRTLQVFHSIQTRNSGPHFLSHFLKKASGHSLPNRKGHLSSLLSPTKLRSQHHFITACLFIYSLSTSCLLETCCTITRKWWTQEVDIIMEKFSNMVKVTLLGRCWGGTWTQAWFQPPSCLNCHGKSLRCVVSQIGDEFEKDI